MAVSADFESTLNQYGKASDSVSLSLISDFTIEFWLKAETLPSTLAANVNIAAKWHSSVDKRSYRALIESVGNKLAVFTSSDGLGASVTSAIATTAITTGAWLYRAVSYNLAAGTCAFYKGDVDNAPSTDGTGASLNTSIHDNDSELGIGTTNHQTGAVEFYDGLLYYVRIFKDIRTIGELQANYKSNVTDANLVADYFRNDATTDNSGNSNTLTLVGSPVTSTDVPFTVSSGSGLQNKIW